MTQIDERADAARRRTGTLSCISGRRPGDHVCWTYASDDDRRRVLTTYFREGIEAGERLAYFAPEAQRDEVLEALGEEGYDGERLVAERTLLVGTFGDPTADRDEPMVPDVRALTDRAIADGYAGLRVCEDGALMLRAGRRSWPTEELRADLRMTRKPMMSLCAYDVRDCDEEGLRLLRAVHPLRLAQEPEPVGSTAFHVHGTQDGVLALTGEIDFSSARTVRELAMAVLDEVQYPILDLSGLTFADVGGVRAIGTIASALADRLGPVTIRHPSALVRKMWDALGLGAGDWLRLEP